MCRVLCLSESGYYRWLRNREKRNRRQLLAVKIDAILAEHPDNRNYGVDRVCLALEQDGVDVSRRTVYRVMKENGWLHKKRVPHGITKTTTEAQEQENILKRDFSAQRPLEKFLTDITEVQCADGKLYVSPIMDCFNGEIVALEMRDNMKKELCIDTVRQLGRIYPNLKGAVFHSDRGSQYTSAAFRAELSRRGMDQTEQAKETHRMEIVNDIYKKLHDLDYFLLRYGPKDVAKYVEDDSTVSKYYGTLPFY